MLFWNYRNLEYFILYLLVKNENVYMNCKILDRIMLYLVVGGGEMSGFVLISCDS